MKSYPKKWGKLFERYLDEYLPERKDEICARADRRYVVGDGEIKNRQSSLDSAGNIE